MDVHHTAHYAAFFAPHHSVLCLSLGGIALFDESGKIVQVFTIRKVLRRGYAVYFAGPYVANGLPSTEFLDIPASSPLGCYNSEDGISQRFFDELRFLSPGEKWGHYQIRCGAICFKSQKLPGLAVYFCLVPQPLQMPKCKEALAIQPAPTNEGSVQKTVREATIRVQIPKIKYANQLGTYRHNSMEEEAANGGQAPVDTPQQHPPANCLAPAPVVTIFKISRPHTADQMSMQGGKVSAPSPSKLVFELQHDLPSYERGRVTNIFGDVLIEAGRSSTFKTRKQQSMALVEYMDSVFGSTDGFVRFGGTSALSHMAEKVKAGLGDQVVQQPIKVFYNKHDEAKYQGMPIQQLFEKMMGQQSALFRFHLFQCHC